jgi:alpha-D-ribose 1-methylphosphonate 5-triphosphate synthase subunit PhnG
VTAARPAEIEARREMMRACALATRAELAVAMETLGPRADAQELRSSENGLVMVRGRMGGDGRPFNLGEASVTRAAVRLADGRVGVAYQLGRDRTKARIAAIIDALWQGGERMAVEQAIAPVRARIAADGTRRARETAATRVEFFTMARGED